MLEKKFLIDKEALSAAVKVKYIVGCIKNNVELEKYKENTIEINNNVPDNLIKRIKVIRKKIMKLIII